MTLLYRLFILLLLVIASPLMGCIALFILVTSGSPVLFRQRRTGKNGRPFIMYKFRTMVVDAEVRRASLRSRNESRGPTFKIHDDPRFTPAGKFLSHTGLDELPQLVNVLRGDMALIGPRPLPVAEAKRLLPWMLERHRILPGIISPAILTGTYHQNFTTWMRSDVSYARDKSPLSDTRLLVLFMKFILKLFVIETAEYVGAKSGRAIGIAQTRRQNFLKRGLSA